MSASAQLDAATLAVYTSTDQRERLGAEQFLVSAFPPPAGQAPAPNSHLAAAHPAHLQRLTQLLGASGSPYTWQFCLSSLVLCIDNSWVGVPQDTQWEVRTLLLTWLADRGPACEQAGPMGSGARSSAITALCRITKLCWREDARHHATAAHALQFLAPGSSQHWPLGLQLWSRLVDDMQRPHPHLRDRPTVRMLMFRDLALRPLFTRLAGLLQELLPAAHAAAAAAAAAPAPAASAAAAAAASPHLTQLSSILHLAASALELVESVLGFDFSCGLSGASGASGRGGPRGGGGSEEEWGLAEEEEEEEGGGGQEEEEEGLGGEEDDGGWAGGGSRGGSGDSGGCYDMREIECAQLPSSWTALAHLGCVSPIFAWLRMALALHAMPTAAAMAGGSASASSASSSGGGGALTAALQQHPPLGALVHHLGRVAIRAASASVATSSVFFTPRTLAARTRLFLTQTTLLLGYLLHSPAYGSLAGAGWVHEASRLLFRLKLALPLPLLARYPRLTVAFLSMATHWTYGLLGVSGGEGGSSSSVRRPLAGSNTVYYLLSFWVLLLLPTVHLSEGELVFNMLRSAIPHIGDALLGRFAPVPHDPRTGGSSSSSSSSAEEGSDALGEEDAEALAGSGGSGGDAVEDDTIELAAEVCKYHSEQAAGNASARMEALLDILKGSASGAGMDASATLARDCQRSLSWLVRFGSLLTNSVLCSAEAGEQGGGRRVEVWCLGRGEEEGGGGGGGGGGGMSSGGGGGSSLTTAAGFPSLSPQACLQRTQQALPALFAAVCFRDTAPAAAAIASGAVAAKAGGGGGAQQQQQQQQQSDSRRAMWEEASKHDSAARQFSSSSGGHYGEGVGAGEEDEEEEEEEESGGRALAEAGRWAASKSTGGGAVFTDTGAVIGGAQQQQQQPQPGGSNGYNFLANPSLTCPVHRTLLEVHPSLFPTDFGGEGGYPALQGPGSSTGLSALPLQGLGDEEEGGEGSAYDSMPPLISASAAAAAGSYSYYPPPPTAAASAAAPRSPWDLPSSSHSATSTGATGGGASSSSSSSEEEGRLTVEGVIAPLSASIFRLLMYLRGRAVVVGAVASKQAAVTAGVLGPRGGGEGAYAFRAAISAAAAAAPGGGGSGGGNGSGGGEEDTLGDIDDVGANLAKALEALSVTKQTQKTQQRKLQQVLLQRQQQGQQGQHPHSFAATAAAAAAPSAFQGSSPPDPRTSTARGQQRTFSPLVIAGGDSRGGGGMGGDLLTIATPASPTPLPSRTGWWQGGAAGPLAQQAAAAPPPAFRPSRPTTPGPFPSGGSTPSGRTSPSLLGPLGESPPSYLRCKPGDEWGAARLTLELAVLSFCSHFQEWYARYRGAASAVGRAEGVLGVLHAGGGGSSSGMGGGYAAASAATAAAGLFRPRQEESPEEVESNAELRAWYSLGPGALSTRIEAQRSRNYLLALLHAMQPEQQRRRGGGGMTAAAAAAAPPSSAIGAPEDITIIDLLDVVCAKALDNLRFPGTPLGAVKASLTLLHDLSLGVMVVPSGGSAESPGSPLADAILPTEAAAGGHFFSSDPALHWIRSGTGQHSGQQPRLEQVDMGQDVLATRCVLALLRRSPSPAWLPSLDTPSRARHLTHLFGMLTRLLFLHARSSFPPPSQAILPLAAEAAGGDGGGSGSSSSSSSSSSSARGSAKQHRSEFSTEGPAAREAPSAWSYSAFPAAPCGQPTAPLSRTLSTPALDSSSAWFSRFSAGLTQGAVGLRLFLGLPGQPGLAECASAASCAATVQGFLSTLQARAGGGGGGSSTSASALTTSPSLPQAAQSMLSAYGPRLIPWLRCLRGLLSAAATPLEYALVSDWLWACGIPTVLLLTAHSLAALGGVERSREGVACAIPLLRLLSEWLSNREGRSHMYGGGGGGGEDGSSASLRAVAHYSVCALAGSALTALAQGLTASVQRSSGSGATSSSSGSGVPRPALPSATLLKLSQLTLAASARLLNTAAGCNTAVAALFGDVSFPALWQAAMGLAAALPLACMGAHHKLARECVGVVRALCHAPLPMPPPPAAGGGDGAASTSAASATGCFLPPSLAAGLAPSTDTFLAITSCTPSPLALASALALPSHLLLPLLQKLVWMLLYAGRRQGGAQRGAAASAAARGTAASASAAVASSQRAAAAHAALMGRHSGEGGGAPGSAGEAATATATGSGAPILGHAAVLNALSTLEAVLTLEGEARCLLAALSTSAGSSSGGGGGGGGGTEAAGSSDPALRAVLARTHRLMHLPNSSLRLSPAAALWVVGVCEGHASAPLSAAASPAAAAQAFAAALAPPPPPGSPPPTPPSPAATAAGLFGTDFLTSLLLLAVRSPRFYTHALARVLLPAIVCRPGLLEAAAQALALAFAPEHASAVLARVAALGSVAMARTRGGAGVCEEAKDAFARETARFSLQLHAWL